ncbi:MAG: hypothetical protein ACKO6N_07420 [Myxococcota bacterium]
MKPSNVKSGGLSRRGLLAGAGTLGALSVMDWLGLFAREGVPGTRKLWELSTARAAEDSSTGGAEETRFLIYWFQEGGWDSYALFAPVDSANDSSIVVPAGELYPTPSWSDQRYRVKGFGTSPYPYASTVNGLRVGYLALPGQALFPDLCLLSSHYGNTFHSGGRFDYHYGRYDRSLTGYRQADERSVMQAFCEAKGSSFLLPHISWHRWLADGELALSNYPEGTGYYEKLGPAYAHTIYGKTPEYFRQRLMAIGNVADAARAERIRQYTDNLQDNFLRGRDGASVKAFASAVEIYRSLKSGELTVDPSTLFTDPDLRAHFGVSSADESPTETSVNGNPARSKESPHVRVQAMMTYECMRALLGCAYWIESRNVRRFDAHRSRKEVLEKDSNSDQLATIKDELWNPLIAFVSKLKSTEMPGMAGKSLWDQTTIVLCSEMGRTLSGDVTEILESTNTDSEKYTQVIEQDVCQHWHVNGVGFLGGSVRGGRQYGGVGTSTFEAIPILPDGSLDPAFDPVTGKQLRTPSSQGFVPDAGHVYATALKLAGVDPVGKGRNTRSALTFI